MHRGTDFAAPTGTPIMASGSGTVTRARWCGGGGNCVKIRHNSTYETIYAHMSKFARGIKEGKKVKQGQIIGYVGSTGMSTGPHLHYEVVVNGKKVNSQKLKLPSGKILKNEAREKFELERIKIDLKLAELRTKINLNYIFLFLMIFSYSIFSFFIEGLAGFMIYFCKFSRIMFSVL